MQDLQGWLALAEVDIDALVEMIRGQVPQGPQAGLLLFEGPVGAVHQAPTQRGQAPALVGVRLGLRHLPSGERGSYVAWFGVDEAPGELRVAFDHLDASLSQPAPKLPVAALAQLLAAADSLGLAKLPTFTIPIGHDVVLRPRSAWSGGRGRLALFVGLARPPAGLSLSASSTDPQLTGLTLLHRPGQGFAPSGGLIGGHLGEAIALQIDGARLGALLSHDLGALSPMKISADPPLHLEVRRAQITGLVSMGVTIDVSLALGPPGDLKPIDLRGSVYLGGVLERLPDGGPFRFRVSVNLRDLQVVGALGAAITLVPLILPILAPIAWLVFNAVRVDILTAQNDRASAALQGQLDGALSGLIGAALQQTSDALLISVIERAVLTRVAIDGAGITVGVGIDREERPAGGVTRTPVHSPRLTGLSPTVVFVGVDRDGDAFPPVGDSLVLRPGVAVPALVPRLEVNTGPVRPRLAPNTRLTLAGRDLSRAQGVRLEQRGVTRTTATIISRGDTRLECDLPLRGLASGWYDIVVSAPDGEARRPAAIEATLLRPPPVVGAITSLELGGIRFERSPEGFIAPLRVDLPRDPVVAPITPGPVAGPRSPRRPG